MAAGALSAALLRRGLRASSQAAFARYVGGRPSYYVLHYEFVEGIKEKRTPFRKEHLDQADKEVRKGKLLLGGASGDPPDSGLVVFKNVSEEEVEAFAASDPYVRNGLVTKWTVKPWAVVAGTLAEVD